MLFICEQSKQYDYMHLANQLEDNMCSADSNDHQVNELDKDIASSNVKDSAALDVADAFTSLTISNFRYLVYSRQRGKR